MALTDVRPLGRSGLIGRFVRKCRLHDEVVLATEFTDENGRTPEQWSGPITQDQQASSSKLKDSERRIQRVAHNQDWNAGVLGCTAPR